jgi:methylmalonyl-CoA/ethylmalonyl-CoA epimerase
MKLHHIGKVVKDLDEAQAYYQDTFGLKQVGKRIVDPIQQVEVVLIETGFGEDPTIELIRPIGDKSPVARFLAKTGGGLHHLSFEVDNIHQAIKDMEAKGAKALGEVVPSAAHKSPSVWLYTRSRELIELIQAKE